MSEEISFFFLLLGEKIILAGAFRFELKTPVLETGIFPVETTRLFRFWIKNFAQLQI